MSVEICDCGLKQQKSTSVISVEVPYSKVLSISKYIEFVRNSVGAEIFDKNMNMLIDAYLKQNPQKLEKYGSLKWSWEKELEFGNEKEQERWNKLKNGIFEGEDKFSEKLEQDKNRKLWSILNYVIPISGTAKTFVQGKTEQIYVKAFGLSIYIGCLVINFEAPPMYLRLRSCRSSRYARFQKYVGLKTFNIQDFKREYPKDFNFMDAFCIDGPLMRIHSIIRDEDGTETPIDYFGDYSFNIHLSKTIKKEEPKVRTEVDKNGKAKYVSYKVPVIRGQKEDTYPIPIQKYQIIFNWMKKFKDYEMATVSIKLVKDAPEEPEVNDLAEEDGEVQELELEK